MESSSLARLSTGVSGLDTVLHGGLIAGRNYLVRGEPGAGKTILGYHFLTEGVENGETCLFINLEETTAEATRNAATLGFDLEAVHTLDLSPESEFFVEDRSYDIFESSDVEEDPLTDAIAERVGDLEPDRVFVDPLTQLQYLAPDEYQFRKQVLAFMRFLKEKGATVLYTAQDTPSTPDVDLQFLSDGIIELGADDRGRSLAVPKFRGSKREGGTHGMRIDGDGITVFPELVPSDHTQVFDNEQISSGIAGLDALLGGGIERGTVTVISGPSGVGKTTTGALFATAAASRGERAMLSLFEESPETFVHRTDAIGIPVTEQVEAGTLAIEGIEPLQRSPQEFAEMVRREVEQRDTRVVMIDGIDGYRLSIQGDEDALTRKLHALCRYLKNMGVTVILIDTIDDVTGTMRTTNAGVSYLADNILFLRYIEMAGELRKVTGVLKKRTSEFEHTLREFEITGDGVVVGDPLTELRGILSGSPESVSSPSETD